MWKDIKNKYVVERNKRRRRNSKTKIPFILFLFFMLRHCEKRWRAENLATFLAASRKCRCQNSNQFRTQTKKLFKKWHTGYYDYCYTMSTTLQINFPGIITSRSPHLCNLFQGVGKCTKTFRIKLIYSENWKISFLKKFYFKSCSWKCIFPVYAYRRDWWRR